jgi:hypothetical protein
MIIHIPVRHRQQGGKITLKVNIAEPGRSLLDRPLLLSQMFLHSVFCLYIWSNSSVSCCFLTSLTNSFTFGLFFPFRRHHVLSVRYLKLRQLLRWIVELILLAVTCYTLHNMLAILSCIPLNCYHISLDHKFRVAKRMYKLRTSAGPLLSARDAGQRLRERSHSSQR